MPESINSKLKEQYDHDDSGGSLDTNLGDFLDSESASGTSNNTKWRNWAEGTGTSLNTRLFNKHGGSGSFMTRWKNWVAFSSTHSINFDGSNDYLDCGNPTGLQITGAFTISLWAKLDSSASDGTLYIMAGKDASYKGWNLQRSTANKIVFYAETGTPSNLSDIATSSSTITDSNWHHYVGVFHGDGSTQSKIYIDGSDVTSNSGSTFSTMTDSGGNLQVGKSPRQTTLGWLGLIDEVAVWSVALSSSDVTSIYNNGKIIDLSNSTAYAVDRTANLKLWLRCGDKAEPESNTAIARQDFYTDFDGTNDFVDIGDFDKASGGSNGAFTVMAWFKANTIGAYDTIVSKWNNSGTLREWLFRPNDASKIEFRLFDESADKTIGRFYNTAISTGIWYHYACTYDGSTGSGSNDGVKIYENGVRVDDTDISGSDEANFAGIENLGGSLQIGSLYDSGQANFFDGAMSSVSLYQTVLDAQTIKQFAKSRFTPMRDNRFSVVDFDGTNDYITSSVSNFRNTDSSGGITAWVKLDSTGWMTIFSSRQASSTNYYVTLGIAGGTNGIFVASKNNDSASDVRGATDISGGGWHHVAVISDGSEYKLYVDGVLETLGTNTNNDGDWFADTTNTDVIRIGDNTGGTGYFNGDIASVAVYSSLSEDEVYAQYAKGITANHSSDTNLVGYWRMGDDISKAYPTIADSSSNSNDGTITNSLSNNVAQQMVAGYDLGAFESTGDEVSGELIPNNDFSTNDSTGYTSIASGWTFSGGTAIWSGTSGGTGGFYTATDIFDDTSALYKVTIDVASISNCKVRLLRGGTDVVSVHTDTAGVYTTFSTITGTGPAVVGLTNGSGTTSCVLNSISVQKVLQSADLSDTYPAIIDVTQPVLGVNLVDANTNSNWESSGSNTIGNITNGISITYVDNTVGSFAYLRDVKLTSTDLTVGAIYKLTYNAYYSGGSGNPYVEVYNGAVSFNGDAITTTDTSYSIYFNAVGDVSSFVRIQSMSSSNVLYLTNLSLQEVRGNVGTMTNMASSDLVYSSVLPDQSFLTGVNSAYNFIDLDGSDQSISGSISRGDAITEFTFSTWTNIDSFSDYERIFSGDDGTVRAGFRSTGKFTFHPNTAIGDTDSTGSAYSTGQWYHTMVTYNKATTTLKYYRDGDLAFTKDDCSSSDMDISGLFWIGSYRGIALFLDGSVGQTAIWDRDLSSDVGSIYNLGRHGNLLDSYSDNLLGYFAMGALDASTGLSDSISTIYDRSGNSNHGTPQNADAGDLKSPPNAQPNGYAKGDTNRSTTTP